MLRVSASLLLLLAGSFTLAQTPSDPPAASNDSKAKISQAQIMLGLEMRRLSSNHGCPLWPTGRRLSR